MKCVNCNTETTNPKFCSRSCSVTHQNTESHWRSKIPKKIRPPCLSCGGDLGDRHNTKFCSIQCQQDHQHKQRIENWLNDGITPGIKVIRRYLREKYNSTCTSCNLSEWLDKPITLEVEHIDGNSENDNENNLTLLCPNCHSQTPTYKAKNKGNGRHSRMKRYHEGKSF